MFNIFKFKKNIFKEYQPLINEINFLENKLQFLTNEDLKYKMLELRKKYLESTQTSKNILIESFALTREVSKRTIGLRHYDEQLLGGLILQQGKVVEMKTGEGKTLVATLPASFNALTQEGVHIITVNDYLAKRDEAWMGQVFKNLGLTVGLIETTTPKENRKNAYSCDITYVNNSELGFDYLRDNLAYELDDIVQRPFNYCIIDEIDSILIDESRTPLVISGLVPIDSNIYIEAFEVSKHLEKFIDSEIDERLKNITLTEAGFLKIERILNIENIFESETPWLFHIDNALRARNFYLKEVDYIVKDNQINIIDEFTGRMMPDRRWDKGLHEAIEAKENLLIDNSSESLASITYQNFFTLYPKLSGMTGTAKTAEQEFENTYQLEVSVLPTHLPFKREDLPDRVYNNEIAKWKAVVKECILLNKTGRPILIGTSTIEKSEIVSLLLKNYNVRHKTLNAKPENLMFESDIIAQAGCKNAITIATNMAGRGTDIILGGTVKHKTKKFIKYFFYLNSISIIQSTLIFFFLKIFKKKNIKVFDNLDYLFCFFEKQFDEIKSTNELSELFYNINNKRVINSIEIIYNYVINNYMLCNDKQTQEIRELGGLFVIGTERQESRRIDNQLRGRAGRQGDPGSSRFFLSLEDKIFKNNIRIPNLDYGNEDSPLESKFLSKALDFSQQKTENFYYEIRKNLYKYDEVLNEQRKIFYKNRSLILKTSTIENWIIEWEEDLIIDYINYLKKFNSKKTPRNLEKKIMLLKELTGISLNFNENKLPNLILFDLLFSELWLSSEIKKILGDEIFSDQTFETSSILRAMDVCWCEHLEKMSELRESTRWQAYAQKDPFIVYKQEAMSLFLNMNDEIMDILILDRLVSDIL